MKAWQKLLAQMHEILDEDEENKNYGVRRMQIALEQRGIKRSLSTVRRAMARGNLLHEDRRTPEGLTKADKKAMRCISRLEPVCQIVWQIDLPLMPNF